MTKDFKKKKGHLSSLQAMIQVLVVMYFLASALAECSCEQKNLAEDLKRAETVLLVKVTNPGRFVKAGKNQDRSTWIYEGVNVLHVFKGRCSSFGEGLRVEQLIDPHLSCQDVTLLPSSSSKNLDPHIRDVGETSSKTSSGVFLIAGRYGTGGNAKVFYMDPCSLIYSDKLNLLDAGRHGDLELNAKVLQFADQCFLEEPSAMAPVFTGSPMVPTQVVTDAIRAGKDAFAARSTEQEELDKKKGAVATAFDYIIEAFPDQVRTLNNPFRGAPEKCYFKADRAGAEKEGDALTFLFKGSSLDLDSDKDGIAHRQLFFRSWRNVLSSLVADIAGSMVITRAWPVRANLSLDSSRLDNEVVGSCQSLVDTEKGGWKQPSRTIKIDCFAVQEEIQKTKGSKPCEWALINTKEKQISPACLGDAEIRDKDFKKEITSTDGFKFTLLCRGVQDVPCEKLQSNWEKNWLQKPIGDLWRYDQSYQVGIYGLDGVFQNQREACGAFIYDNYGLLTLPARLKGTIRSRKTRDFVLPPSAPPSSVSGWPQIVADLIELHLLDYICGQVDRQFNFFYQENAVAGHNSVLAIDNDLSWGDFPRVNQLKEKLGAGSKLPPKLPPFVSKATFHRIRRITADKLDRLINLVPEKGRQFFYVAKAKQRLESVLKHLKELENTNAVIADGAFSKTHLGQLNHENSYVGIWMGSYEKSKDGCGSDFCKS